MSSKKAAGYTRNVKPNEPSKPRRHSDSIIHNIPYPRTDNRDTSSAAPQGIILFGTVTRGSNSP